MPRGFTYHARFSNGRTLKRTSYRSYTHAWFASGEMPERVVGGSTYPAGNWARGGFSTSAAQAHKNMAGEIAWYVKNSYGPAFSEVVEVSTDAPNEPK